MGSEAVIVKFVNSLIGRKHLFKYRPDLLHVAVGFGSEHFLDNIH